MKNISIFILFIILFSSINIVSQTPKWELNYFVDDFGDKTDSKFLSVEIYDGKFSNIVTRNSSLCGLVIVTDSSIQFRLLEYCSSDNPFVSFGDLRIIQVKLSNGKLLTNGYDDSLSDTNLLLFQNQLSSKLKMTNGKSVYSIFIDGLIESKDYIKVLIKKDFSSSDESEYVFSIPTNGFEKLYKREYIK